MTIITGELNSYADNDAAADAFIAAVESALSSHPSGAWSFVEEVTISSNSYRIWKNSGTVNTWGSDFYIGIKYANTMPSTADNATLYFMLFEGYDAGTNLATRIAASSSSITIESDDSTGTATFALSSSAINVDCNALIARENNSYVFSVTKDRVIIRVTSSYSDNTFFYIGLIQPLNNHPNENGLIIYNFFGSNANSGAFTRATGHYERNGASAGSFAFTADVSHFNLMLTFGSVESVGVSSAVDIAVRGYWTTFSPYSVYRGLFKGIYEVPVIANSEMGGSATGSDGTALVNLDSRGYGNSLFVSDEE